ncbi:hypothetical protein [uncultured Ruegeria sp.]|uniref:hypothetical protein n=1 Tax=uncultured Ruegeria sp. TaxID=259304 RepID=UPI00263273D6|nr:hypothetical protein [uncultured Ruegeria sp.]
MSEAKQSKELAEAKDTTLKVKDLPKVGVAFGGSQSEGQVASHSEGALNEIFGTDDENLAAALTQHSLKVLGKYESGDGPEGTDERDFMMSIVADLGPQDAIPFLNAGKPALKTNDNFRTLQGAILPHLVAYVPLSFLLIMR